MLVEIGLFARLNASTSIDLHSGELTTFFSNREKNWQGYRTDNTVSLGLSSFQKLFTLSGEEHIRQIITSRRHGTEFLGDAIKEGRKLHFDAIPAALKKQAPNTNYEEHKIHPSTRDEAWRWAWGDQPAGEWYWCKSKKLRSWDYVFWDSSRLRGFCCFRQEVISLFLGLQLSNANAIATARMRS